MFCLNAFTVRENPHLGYIYISYDDDDDDELFLWCG